MSFNRPTFFELVRHGPFPGTFTQGQVDGVNALLDAFDKAGPAMADLRFQAYAAGTAFHETAHTMQPIAEIGHGRGRAYGHPAGPWNQVYYGRGLVQLTWQRNYVLATTRLRALGVIDANTDLEKTPDLAMRPDIAAAIMVHGMFEGWFTGKKLADYFNATVTDWKNARRIINGTDRAALIAGYGEQFFEDLTKATAA